MAVDWAAAEALGTLGAFGVAIAVYAGNLRDKRRAQAGLVAAWVESYRADPPPFTPKNPFFARGMRSRRLVLANNSDQPVFDLHVVPLAGHGEAEPVVPAALPPGERLNIPAARVGGPWNRLPAPVNLHFTDVAGRQWHRRGQQHTLRRCRRWCASHSKPSATTTEPADAGEGVEEHSDEP